MIGYIEGVVVRASDDTIVVKIDGMGIGLDVVVPRRAQAAIGQHVQLHIHTHTGSDLVLLAGFEAVGDLKMYRHLLDVSGVGPRMAVRVLSNHPTDRIIQALDDEDPALFQAVSGIGRKLASRIILELRGKLVPGDGIRMRAGAPDGVDVAMDALRSLGFTDTEATLALRPLAGQELSVEDRISAALRDIGNRAKKT